MGRIIGKGGQNVRELQRVTGSIIKLPEHNADPPADEETTVHIIGQFFSVQVCIFRKKNPQFLGVILNFIRLSRLCSLRNEEFAP